MDPELVCYAQNKKSDGYGELNGEHSFLFECSLGLARMLRESDNFLLACLGKVYSFEIAVGMNGRVWVNTKSITHTIQISNAIQTSEGMDRQQIKSMVDMLKARNK